MRLASLLIWCEQHKTFAGLPGTPTPAAGHRGQPGLPHAVPHALLPAGPLSAAPSAPAPAAAAPMPPGAQLGTHPGPLAQHRVRRRGAREPRSVAYRRQSPIHQTLQSCSLFAVVPRTVRVNEPGRPEAGSRLRGASGGQGLEQGGSRGSPGPAACPAPRALFPESAGGVVSWGAPEKPLGQRKRGPSGTLGRPGSAAPPTKWSPERGGGLPRVCKPRTGKNVARPVCPRPRPCSPCAGATPAPHAPRAPSAAPARAEHLLTRNATAPGGPAVGSPPLAPASRGRQRKLP